MIAVVTKHIVLVIAVVAISAPTSRGRELSLAESIRLARQHAPQLAASAANVAAAREQTNSVRAERLGTLSVTSSANYISELSRLSISIPNLPPVEREIGSHETFQNDLRYSLPVWSGGRLGTSIEIASVSESIAEAVAASDTLRIIYQTHLEYFNLAAAQESVRLAGLTLARVRNLQKEVRDLHAAGLADSLALIEAELSVNRSILQLDHATDIRRRAEIRLLQLCGLPVDDPLVLNDSLSPPSALSGSAISSARPELFAAQRRISLAESRMRLQRAEYWPSLGAFAGYAYGKPNLDRFGNSWNDYWSAGAQLTWSFNIGGKNSRALRRSQFERSAAQSEYDRVREGLTTEQLLSRERVEIARTSFATQQERAELRAAAFRLSQIQFREGILSATRLFDAEQLLGEAELSAALSLIDWYAARSAYWYAAGAPELSQGL